MAKMFITLKVMPESLDIDFQDLRKQIKEIAVKHGGELLDKDAFEDVAFGLKALKVMIYIDESKGSEEISEEVASLDIVSSSTVIDMRRAVG